MIIFFILHLLKKIVPEVFTLLSLLKIVKLVISDFQALFWYLVQYKVRHTYTEQSI